MKPSAAPLRLVLSPVLLALMLGAAGFAAGWWLRPEVHAGVAPPSASGRDATPVSSAPESDEVGDPIEPIASGRARPVAGPSAPDPTIARARLAAWVEAGCPSGEGHEISQLLEAWSRGDAAGALAFVHGAPCFRGRSYAYRIPLAHLALADPDAMIAWIQRELPVELRDDVLARTVSHLGNLDPARAMALAVDATGDQAHVVTQALEKLTAADPEAARAWFERLDVATQKHGASDFAHEWLSRDRARAGAWCLAQQGQPWGPSVLRMLVRHLAHEAPAELPAVLALPGLPPDVPINALSYLGMSDPATALDIASRLPPDIVGVAVDQMFGTLFHESPDAAIELARGTIAPEALARHVREQWSRWLVSDRPAALAWAAQAGDPTLRRELDLELRRHEVARDPAGFLQSCIPAGTATDEAGLVQLALVRLSASDVASAVRWATTHADTLTAESASVLGARLLTQAPDQVLPWLESLPPGAARDAACVAIAANDAMLTQPAGFTDVVTLIDDPVLQTGTTYEIFRSMFRLSSSAAERWLALQPLSEEVRTSWQAIAERQEITQGRQIRR